ncbi:RNA polymerase [Streptomyces armeniacus]|uniref:RNA polymerase n=2 Tax=Streptomyces armeniacus TaxID=83291 RepID=A0A345XQA4_9ACTN|nr:sigma factor-like helix-turn-helix DNA-binding protein [Streptomyces armeniacus]AXK33820.1 RNA polymerase [Streptomyces armeniacus]
MPQAGHDPRRARDFEAFVAGAGGRLLHAATLLTGERSGAAPAAERLLIGALARTYAGWDRLRGEDPYDRTRQELAARFARTAWRHRRPRGGLLDRLPPQERLVLVLRLYEGVAEEQVAAALGLPVERVRALCRRAAAAMRSRPPARTGGAAPPPRGRAPRRTPARTATGTQREVEGAA